MNILADENIPWAREAFGAYGNVRTMPGRSIGRGDLDDVDALVVRSVTDVGRALLDGTPVRFVGTATIGVDTEYLQHASIGFASAAGSNATSVAEYVVAALLELWSRGAVALDACRLGIVGLGDVGTRVARFAQALGVSAVLYDPPRALAEPGFRSAAQEELDGCDVVTLHVPLTRDVEHPTEHMIDARFIGRLRAGSVLINSARGGVVAGDALLGALHSGHIAAAALDVWEGEPDVPVDLVNACAIATPHIAGYAVDAKLRGTAMMADALAVFSGSTVRWDTSRILPPRVGRVRIEPGRTPHEAALEAVRAAYPIVRDDAALRLLLHEPAGERRAGFDRLRRDYPERREFGALGVVADDPAVASCLAGLGFVVEESPVAPRS